MEAALSTAELLDRARTSTGLADFGSRHFERFLDAWCVDLTSTTLSGHGRAALARLAQRNLETRLRVLDTLRRHPEIEQVPLPPIVRIMGFPRSGTTLLHNLMALRSGSRSLLRWELVSPVPPPDAATYAIDPRIAHVQRSVDTLRGTDLERMHWVETADPEECTWGFLDVSGLLGRGGGGLMRSWGEEIFRRDLAQRETYEEYRRLVQLLLWRNPIGPDGVLVLKCPTDCGHIATFLDVFPEATLVLCHRDPVRTLISTRRIEDVIHRPFLADPAHLGERAATADLRALRVQAGFADGMVEADGRHAERVTHVRYPDLMGDPAGVVADAFETLSIPVDRSALTAAVARFLADQKNGRRASPPERYEDLTLTAEQIREDPSTARYTTTFSVPEEQVRITAPAG